ncbi:MAG: polysaccharide deacetylase family protein [bacterium]
MNKTARHIAPAFLLSIVLPVAIALLVWSCRADPSSWRTPKPGSSIHIPVLAMHRVIPGRKDSYIMTPEDFDLLLTELARQDFTPISLAQLEKALTRKGRLPPRPVVITFDDGFLDGYVHAFPILKRHNFKAAFFVPTGYIADSPVEHIRWGEGIVPAGITNADPGDLVCMNWSDLAKLRDAGMDIGSHGISHLNMMKLDDAALKTELTLSRKTLEDHLGIGVTSITYPGGRRDDRVCQAARDAGYTMGFRSHGSSILLYPTNLVDLKRVAIPGYGNVTQIVASLPGCDWKEAETK